MVILGLGGIITDAAAALVKAGTLVAAVEQKKVARYSRPGQTPLEAVDACLHSAQLERRHVDMVAVVRPLAAGAETALHLELRGAFPNAQVLLLDHHAAHAASAYYASPFEEATVLTLDRQGDLRCGARWLGERNRLTLDRELYFPDSLGDLYSRVTTLLGFVQNQDEHKVQWLSTSGDDRFVALFEDVMGIASGWPRQNPAYFDSHRIGSGGFGAKLYEALGIADAGPVPAALKPHIAAGVQRAVERAVALMAGDGENLALAGGLAFNALLIHSLETSGRWKNVFVQPVSGNAGTALGAALHCWHAAANQNARMVLDTVCLGPFYTAEEVKRVLENCKLRFRYLLTEGELIESAVGQLNENKIVAWMQGRMEFGPRALGNRSILASPLNPYSTENLNSYIKHREPFRKFAASVPAELVGEYFDVGPNARFLATVGRVKKAHRATFESAILGQDFVRVHAVREQDNPLYWHLLHAAGKSTGLPVLYNTSFNLFGDPLVCTPRDAVRSFYSSGIDTLFAGNFMMQK
jgi:carbamoyltransferase